jgi:hypothetical protein
LKKSGFKEVRSRTLAARTKNVARVGHPFIGGKKSRRSLRSAAQVSAGVAEKQDSPFGPCLLKPTPASNVAA